MPHSALIPAKDQLFRFLFEQTNIRGELVHLDDSWQAVLQRHNYPAPIRDLLGEAMAAAALLGATLKHDGALIIQIQGDGPVPLLVVQIDNQTQLRGMAEWHGDITPGNLQHLCGKGRLTITIDPADDKERYQSIIELGSDSLARTLDNYFQQSEQLNTRLWLAANERCAAGLLLQELPAELSQKMLNENPLATQDEDAWNRVILLSETLTATELRDLPTSEILKRLYHQEDVRLFEPDRLFFNCSCSRERITNTLRSLGEDEIQSIIEQEGKVSVECSFCKKNYAFDPVDCEALFSADISPEGNNTQH